MHDAEARAPIRLVGASSGRAKGGPALVGVALTKMAGSSALREEHNMKGVKGDVKWTNLSGYGTQRHIHDVEGQNRGNRGILRC